MSACILGFLFYLHPLLYALLIRRANIPFISIYPFGTCFYNVFICTTIYIFSNILIDIMSFYLAICIISISINMMFRLKKR